MDDESPERKEYPLSPAKLSKTPSWIMLGFVLGALFVAALPPLGRRSAPALEPVRRTDPLPPAAPRAPQPLTVIEAVFAEWGRYAVWSDGTTEVALWNSQEKAFSDFYEVRRVEGVNYFRSLPRLTRRVITHGRILPDSPLQFTETEEQYRDWREHGVTPAPLEEFREETRPAITPRNPAERSIEITAPERVPARPAPLPPVEIPPGARSTGKEGG